MNFEVITSQKYLSYFSSNRCNEQDVLFGQFLSDMETLSENIQTVDLISPVETLRNIKAKTGIESDFPEAVKEWIKPEYNSILTDFDCFTLLWFCTKQNTITFSAEQYLKYANDGTVFALLKKIKK